MSVTFKALENILEHYPPSSEHLISALQDVQAKFNYLPPEAMTAVCDHLGVPLSRGWAVATFYKAFSLVPKGRHEIHVCTGTACHVRGAQRILDRVEDITGIKAGETDQDLKFSLETVNCLGCCAMGPVMVVDGAYYGKLAPAKSEEVLKNYE